MKKKYLLVSMLVITLLFTACTKNDESAVEDSDNLDESEIELVEVDYNQLENEIKKAIIDSMAGNEDLEFVDMNMYKDESVMRTDIPIKSYSNVFTKARINYKNYIDNEDFNEKIFEYEDRLFDAVREINTDDKEKDKIYEVDVEFYNGEEMIDIARVNYMGMTEKADIFREKDDNQYKNEDDALETAYKFAKSNGYVLLNFGVNNEDNFVVTLTSDGAVGTYADDDFGFFEEESEKIKSKVLESKEVEKYMGELKYEEVLIEWVGFAGQRDKIYNIEL